MKNLKNRLIILLGVCIQINLYNYVNVSGATRNVNIKIISATPREVKIQINNKGENTESYSENFSLYKFKKGKWKRIKRISQTPKTLYFIKGKTSKTKKVVCKKTFGKELSRGKYKFKWIQVKKFTIR